MGIDRFQETQLDEALTTFEENTETITNVDRNSYKENFESEQIEYQYKNEHNVQPTITVKHSTSTIRKLDNLLTK